MSARPHRQCTEGSCLSVSPKKYKWMLSPLDYPVHVVHCLCVHLLTHLNTQYTQHLFKRMLHPILKLNHCQWFLMVEFESAWTCVHACGGGLQWLCDEYVTVLVLSMSLGLRTYIGGGVLCWISYALNLCHKSACCGIASCSLWLLFKKASNVHLHSSSPSSDWGMDCCWWYL